MEKNIFLDHVSKQLQKMSVSQKDAWIMAKAKLLLESEQQDFIMSLSGEKIIIYMPTETEIETFCEKVGNGDIYVEYESHYCEFNSEGRYVDNWEVQHNDPHSAFPFLDRTFRGCHDLVQLGEYDLAAGILDKICRLEFRVVEAEASEDVDFQDDSPFTIAEAIEEHQLTMQKRKIGYDWITALLMGKENDESLEFAEKLIDSLGHDLCQETDLSNFSGCISDKLLDFIEEVLEQEINEISAELERLKDRCNKNWHEVHMFQKKMARSQHLLPDLRKKCRKQSDSGEESDKASVLRASWEQICELLETLSYESYIDDQLEIDEVWNICEALVKRDRFGEEDWKVRKEILRNMISHHYYDYYGCYDPIKQLAEKLYITDAEVLEYADLLNEHDYYAREAADLYRQYGRMEQYVRYLETHLGKSSKEYIELISCYCNDGNETGARETAELGLKNCKDDLTELFIFLLKDAKKYSDEGRYKKFYAGAKRRKRVDIVRVNEAIMQ